MEQQDRRGVSCAGLAIENRLPVDVDRPVRDGVDIGSVGAASIPVSLDRLWRSGKLRGGDLVLMVAGGSGISYGAMVYELGTEA